MNAGNAGTSANNESNNPDTANKGSRGKRTALIVGVVVVVVIGITVWLSWDHLKFWWQFESLGRNQQGLPEYRHRETRIVFVKVPGGRFWMGSTDEERKRVIKELVDRIGEHTRKATQEKWEFEKLEFEKRHEVPLSPFLISKYEVTQEQWKKVMGDNPSGIRGENRPVESVSWDDCQQFCMKTSLKLPTEAQWEFACRAGKEGPYDAVSGTGNLDDMGWYKLNTVFGYHPVGRKNPNDFGLHDMHGNVEEWCEDVFDVDFYRRPEASRKNPLCLTGNDCRVLRGGGWGDMRERCRSACRDYDSASYRGYGFRAAFYPLP